MRNHLNTALWAICLASSLSNIAHASDEKPLFNDYNTYKDYYDLNTGLKQLSQLSESCDSFIDDSLTDEEIDFAACLERAYDSIYFYANPDEFLTSARTHGGCYGFLEGDNQKTMPAEDKVNHFQERGFSCLVNFALAIHGDVPSIRKGSSPLISTLMYIMCLDRVIDDREDGCDLPRPTGFTISTP